MRAPGRCQAACGRRGGGRGGRAAPARRSRHGGHSAVIAPWQGLSAFNPANHVTKPQYTPAHVQPNLSLTVEGFCAQALARQHPGGLEAAAAEEAALVRAAAAAAAEAAASAATPRGRPGGARPPTKPAARGAGGAAAAGGSPAAPALGGLPLARQGGSAGAAPAERPAGLPARGRVCSFAEAALVAADDLQARAGGVWRHERASKAAVAEGWQGRCRGALTGLRPADCLLV